MPQTPARNFTKPFSIAGFVLGIIYAAATAFAPSRTGEIVPVAHEFKRLLAIAPFVGISGALVGLGLGLLATALYARLRR
jgi:hypothetical protein